MTVRYAAPADLPAIRTIWLASFPGDTPQAVEHFLAHVFGGENCMLAVVDGQPVSMTFILPAFYHDGGNKRRLQYIYAAATLPEYRGRGIFGALLRQTLRLGENAGLDGSYLRPATPKLVEYYAKFGYTRYFGVIEEWYTAQAVSASAVQAIAAKDYAAERERLLAAHCPVPYVSFSEPVTGYAASTGTVLSNGTHAALAEPADDGMATIRELCGPAAGRETFLDGVCRHTGAKKLKVFRYAEPGETAVFNGMLYPFKDWPPAANPLPYMGLTLE
ncbi:MAG: GNAT family N-acetyltransferase [Oscillospiraceae bacterium]|nr:GNAT family N-acetyltransferase [Oscillospiraceae bacterium]